MGRRHDVGLTETTSGQPVTAGQKGLEDGEVMLVVGDHVVQAAPVAPGHAIARLDAQAVGFEPEADDLHLVRGGAGRAGGPRAVPWLPISACPSPISRRETLTGHDTPAA